MTAPIVIRHGVRTTTFALDSDSLVAVSVVDRYRSGDTVFTPPEVWASDEARREAEAMVAAMDKPRRRKAQ